MIRRPPSSPLFPYTTPFRSEDHRDAQQEDQRPVQRAPAPVEDRRRPAGDEPAEQEGQDGRDRKSTRLNSSHANSSYAVFCLKKKKSLNVARNRMRHTA